MPALKFKIKDIEFEYIGEPEDMSKFIQTLMTGTISVTSLEKIPHKATPITHHGEPTPSENTPLDTPMPSFDDVLAFIVSLPSFHHTLYDVQRHFFHRIFNTTDKDTFVMYFRTREQLKKVREEIEKQYHGKFEKTRGKGRLDYYTFKPEQKSLV